MEKQILPKIFFNQTAKNILRVTISYKDCEQSEFSIIKKEALANSNCEITDFDVNSTPEETQILKDNKLLFNIVNYTLNPVDVIKYTTGKEKPLVESVKTVDGQRTVIKNLYPHKEREAYCGKLDFKLDDSESIFGLGQDEEGVFNRRGSIYYMYQHNMRIPMPCMLSSKGYGVLFDCASLMIFDDTKTPTQMVFDTVDSIDFYLIAGTPHEVIREVRRLTGRAVMLPKWAFGYVQSKETYKTGQELIDIAQKYREIHVPLDCIIQDWKTWEGDLWGQKTVDKKRYPLLQNTNKTLHNLNVHTLVSVWPNMAEGGKNHAEFAKNNMLLGDYSTYDVFNEKARELYWKQADEELFSGGFDGWWCDSTEPFSAPDWCGEKLLEPKQRYELVGSEHKKYLDAAYANYYGLMHAKGIFENQIKTKPNKRVINLTRSGYIGIGQYGGILWAGDTSATWEELKKEIAKGLNVFMSAIPYWTVDVGAFFTGGIECWRKWSGNPQADAVWFWNGDYDDGVNNFCYRELYVRWLQFACFLPMFRSHGTDTPREIWNFGEKGSMFYDAIEKCINLRYHLLPYIYSAAYETAFNDKTMVRSLLFDFFNDKKAVNTSDEFMFGDFLLVCPVTQPMYYGKNGEEILNEKTKTCYLPQGKDWYNYYTGEKYAGGQEVTVKADINTIPLFVASGGIIISQKKVEYTGENNEEYCINIYGDKKSSINFYNDDGTSYNYLNGEYELIEFSWENKVLTINEKQKLLHKPLILTLCYEDKTKIIVYNGGWETINMESNN